MSAAWVLRSGEHSLCVWAVGGALSQELLFQSSEDRGGQDYHHPHYAGGGTEDANYVLSHMRACQWWSGTSKPGLFPEAMSSPPKLSCPAVAGTR